MMEKSHNRQMAKKLVKIHQLTLWIYPYQNHIKFK